MTEEGTGCSFRQERIIAFLDEELDDAARAEVTAHLASCADCARFLAEAGAIYAGADADRDAFHGDISERVRERAEREALLTELRAMRAEMNALRRETAGLREEMARLRNGRGAEASQSVYLLPYAPPSGGPSLLGTSERSKENKWN